MQKLAKIRVDAGPEIGFGHLVRCISLAQMIKEDFSVVFCYKDHRDLVIPVLDAEGFEGVELKNDEEFFEALSSNDFVIVDHYGFGIEQQQRVKELGCLLLCIDDLADRRFVADLILNPAPGVSSDKYAISTKSKLLLGPSYALLRPAFLAASEKRSLNKQIKKAVICFGGSDPKNLTLTAVKALYGKYELIVVLGKGYVFEESLSPFVTGCTVYRNLSAEGVRREFTAADVAIVPASGVLYESIATGVPVISGLYVENQKEFYSGFIGLDVFESAFDFDGEAIVDALGRMDLERRKSIVENQRKCIDGKSPERIRAVIQNLMQSHLYHRKATLEDAEIIYAWNSDDTARQNSFNQSKFSFADHMSWFEKKLSSEESELLVFTNGAGEKIGLIRLDRIDDGALIGINLDANQRGKGYAGRMLSMGTKSWFNRTGKPVFAQIKKTNIASIKAFEKAGYVKDKELLINDVESIQYVYEGK